VWAEWIDKNEGHAISKGVLLGEFILKATASAADFLGAIYPDVTLGQHFRDANVLTMGTHFVWDGTQTPAVQMGTLWWGCRDAMPIRGDDGSIALLAVGELLKRAAPNGNAWAALDVWWLFTSLLSVTGITTIEVDQARAERRRLKRESITDVGPPPWIAYKTLVVQLPPERNARHGGGDRVASAIPFHLVRGHLADYRAGPGMFGDNRLRRVVWKPMHYRGLQRVGAVAKMYDTKMLETGLPKGYAAP